MAAGLICIINNAHVRESEGAYAYTTTGDVLFAECSALCRVSKHGHSAKRQFAECRTRQSRHSAKLVVSTRQTCCLCRVSGLALGKEVPLPSANSDTRQSIFIFFYFFFVFKFCLWHLYSTLKHMFQFGTFLWLFGIFFNFFMFTWIFLEKVNLNCRCMKYWNLAIQKMVFMFFSVFWGRVQGHSWNFEHLFHETLPPTCLKSVF